MITLPPALPPECSEPEIRNQNIGEKPRLGCSHSQGALLPLTRISSPALGRGRATWLLSRPAPPRGSIPGPVPGARALLAAHRSRPNPSRSYRCTRFLSVDTNTASRSLTLRLLSCVPYKRSASWPPLLYPSRRRSRRSLLGRESSNWRGLPSVRPEILRVPRRPSARRASSGARPPG